MAYPPWRKCLAMLSPNNSPKFCIIAKWTKEAALERLNEKYCIMPFGGKVRVLALEQEIDRTVITLYSAADFQLLHGNVWVNPGADKPISLGTWWLKHPLRRQYEGMVFAPGSPRVIDGRLLNLWQGWGITPHKGCWKRLRKQIFKVLAKGDKSLAKYIIKWIAWAFQHPDQRAEVALVFRGESGTGKGVFGRLLCAIFGQHGIHISSHHQLTGKFNKHLLDCAILFADEAFWPGDKSAEGTLKRIITEDTLMIEAKFFDASINKNRLHMIMASNADWVVPATMDDRRFAVADVANTYKHNKSYFEPLYQEIENGGGAAMLYDLLRMDLKEWHPRYDVPKTAALRDQKELSLSAADQWWYEMLKSGALARYDDNNVRNHPRWAPSRTLMDTARKTVPGLRFHSDHALGRILGKKGCFSQTIKGVRGWRFPDLQEARRLGTNRCPALGGKTKRNGKWLSHFRRGTTAFYLFGGGV